MPVGDLAFEPVMNRAASPLRSFGLYLVDVIDQGRIDPNDPVTEALERCFVDLIIERQPHSQGDGMISSPANAHWERILAVTKFVEDNFQNNIKVADIAHAAGCSVRSLEMFISGFWNCTPKMLINLYRLEVARRLLKSGDSSMSVSSAAFDAGFGHPGRFSQMYSDRYGESPSITLQRSRTHGS